MGQKTASNILTINTIQDGASAAFIHTYYYKWSDSFTDMHGDSGWSPVQPQKTSPSTQLYLWRKDVYSTYEEATNSYIDQSSSFLCMNGENGTGFEPKGAAVDIPQASPTGITGEDGMYLMLTGENGYLCLRSNGSWVLQPTPALSDSYIVNKTGDPQDGHAYSFTGSGWVDIGLVRGANGVSSFIHMAWCNRLGTGTDWSSQGTDFTTSKAANTQYKYMGTLVNSDNGQDPDVTHAGEYTWNEVKGQDAYFIIASPSVIPISTDSNFGSNDATSKAITVNIYKGESAEPLTTSITTHGTLPTGVVWDNHSNNTCYIHVANGTDLSTPLSFTIVASAGGVTRIATIQIMGAKAGNDGTSPYFADIDNEMDSVACTYDGKIDQTQNVSTNVSMYLGSTLLSPTIIVKDTNASGTQYVSGEPINGITVTINGGNISVQFDNNTQMSTAKKVFYIKLTVGSGASEVSRELYFTVNLVRAATQGEHAVLWRLIPSCSEIIKLKNNAGTIPASNTNITCQVSKTVGDTPTIVQSGYSLKMQVDGGVEIDYASIFPSSITSQLVYLLYNNTSQNRVLLDKETIGVVREGENGTDGVDGCVCVVEPSTAVWETDVDGVIAEQATLSGDYPSFNGTANIYQGQDAGALTGTTITSITGCPAWFFVVINGANFSITPSKYSVYKNGSNYVYTRGTGVSSGDSVYDENCAKLGTITGISSSGAIQYNDVWWTKQGEREPILTHTNVTITVKNGTIIRYVTLPLIPSKEGADGGDSWLADIDNEMDAVSVDKQGRVPQNTFTEGGITYSQKVETTATLYGGSAKQSFSVLVYDEENIEYQRRTARNGITVDYATGNNNTNTIKVYFASKALVGDKKTFKIVLTSQATSATYNTIFTVKGVEGDVYQLLPSTSKVVFGLSQDGKTLTPESINVYCGYTKNVGGVITEYAGNVVNNLWKEGGAPYNIFYKIQAANGSWGTWDWAKNLTNGTLNVPRSQTWLAIQFVLSNSDSYLPEYLTEDTILDKETILITKSGINGDDGEDAWTFDLISPILSWNTDANDKVIEFTPKSNTARAYKGGVSQTASVSRVTLPPGFVPEIREGGIFSVQPYAKYNSYTSGSTVVYVPYNTGSPVVGDKVYDSDMMYIGTISEIGSYGIKVNGITYTNQSNYTTLLSAPFNGVVTIVSGTITRTTSLTISPSTTGEKGDNGGNSAMVMLYTRSATPVSQTGFPSGFKLYYKFSEGKLYTNQACTTAFVSQDNWYATIQSGNDPIYVTCAVAFDTSDVAAITYNQWVTPAKYAENGTDGAHGINSATILIYKRASSAPSNKPITLYYKFADGKLYSKSGSTYTEATAAQMNNWVREIPNNNGTPCYVRQAAALSNEEYDEIDTNDWSSASRLVDAGNDAYMAQISPSTINVSTNANGDVRSFVAQTIYAYLYKGNASSTETGLTLGVSGLPLGFKATINNSSRTIQIQFVGCTVWSDGDRILYTTEAENQVVANQTVVYSKYGSGEIAVGTVTTVGTGYICINGSSTQYWVQTGQSYTASFQKASNAVVTIAKSGVTTRTCQLAFVPIVKGDMGRTPAYWGDWLEFATQVDGTYPTVNITETETYFWKTTTSGTTRYWIWVGENGTYTAAQMGTPSSSNKNFEIMQDSFKYLITKAVFTDFAKLGSGVFNGDYAFSQWGTNASGVKTKQYQYFMPFGMSSDVTVTSSNTYQTPINLGTFNITIGHTYKFSFELDVADNNIVFSVDVPTSTTSGYHEGSRYFTREYVAQSTTSLTMYVFNKGSNTRNVKVQVVDTTFHPNLYIDWLQGEIYAQLGHFVNVVVEGVLNNLAQTITGSSSNTGNAANFGEVSSEGISGEGSITCFWLDPTKVGGIVKYQAEYPLVLPCAFYNNSSQSTVLIAPNGLTLEKLRQCIGKKIYWLTDGNTSMTKIFCGQTASNPVNDVGMLVYGDGDDINLNNMNLYNRPTTFLRTARFVSNTASSDWFFMLECKMAQYNSHECIFWEIHFNTAKLT